MESKTKLISGQIYHIVNRGVSKRRIFIDDKDYRFFMFLIAKYKKQYSIYIKSYCIMPTHFHLLLSIKNKEKNISTFMKYLQFSYACYFNRTYIHTGHVFQGVFRRKTVDYFDLPRVLNYLEKNPVRKKLVKNPEEWPYRI